ncbi:hypothetical protein ACX9MO_16645 [Pseudooceanicola sp. 502str34]
MTDTQRFDISTFPVAFLHFNSGIAIDPESNTLILLTRASSSSTWQQAIHQVDDIRSIKRASFAPDEFFDSSRSGGGLAGAAHDLGSSIGLAIRNSMERKKAAARSGLELMLRSLETPKFFVNIPDENQLLRAYEAVSQVIDGRGLNGTYNTVSAAVAADIISESHKEPYKSQVGSSDHALKYIPRDEPAEDTSTEDMSDPARKYLPKAKTKEGSPEAKAPRNLAIAIVIIVVVACIVLVPRP